VGSAVPGVGPLSLVALGLALLAVGRWIIKDNRQARNVILLAIGCAALAPLTALAVPNLFQNGTVADATQVNANFADLEARLAAVEARSEGVPLRFTRQAISLLGLLPTFDAACTAEFGPNYQFADLRDVDALWQGTLANTVGSSDGFAIAVGNQIVSLAYVATGSPPSLTLGGTGGSAPVACVRMDAILRFTRAPQATNASVANLDAACVLEFGSRYQLADVRDIQALWQDSRASGQGPNYKFVATYLSGNVSSFYIANSTLVPAGSGSFPAACVRMTP
jgi:hypothetical protein